MSILELFKKETLLKQVVTEIDQMFAKNKQMYKSVIEFMFNNKPIVIDISKEDKELNQFEIEIRKKVFEHLSINPSKDLAFSLIIIDVARDTERIGDYCKNIYKLATEFPNVKKEGKYWAELKSMSDYLEKLIENIHLAFRDANQNLANQEIANYRKAIYLPAWELIKNVANDNSLSNQETAVLILTARYFRRISAFSINIATSVVNEFPKIRYTKDNNDV